LVLVVFYRRSALFIGVVGLAVIIITYMKLPLRRELGKVFGCISLITRGRLYSQGYDSYRLMRGRGIM
jgi:hypothetical protein